MGSSRLRDVPDEDLDRHVAEIILKEAKEKGERYNTQGIKAYLTQGMYVRPNRHQFGFQLMVIL